MVVSREDGWVGLDEEVYGSVEEGHVRCDSDEHGLVD